jgi:hypothetical protein
LDCVGFYLTKGFQIPQKCAHGSISGNVKPNGSLHGRWNRKAPRKNAHKARRSSKETLKEENNPGEIGTSDPGYGQGNP